jgi:hypothetical protein
MKDRKVKQILSEGWYQREWEEDMRKKYRRINIMEILCIYV